MPNLNNNIISTYLFSVSYQGISAFIKSTARDALLEWICQLLSSNWYAIVGATQNTKFPQQVPIFYNRDKTQVRFEGFSS